MPDKDSPNAARIKELEAHIVRRKGRVKEIEATKSRDKETAEYALERNQREIKALEAQITELKEKG